MSMYAQKIVTDRRIVKEGETCDARASRRRGCAPPGRAGPRRPPHPGRGHPARPDRLRGRQPAPLRARAHRPPGGGGQAQGQASLDGAGRAAVAALPLRNDRLLRDLPGPARAAALLEGGAGDGGRHAPGHARRAPLRAHPPPTRAGARAAPRGPGLRPPARPPRGGRSRARPGPAPGAHQIGPPRPGPLRRGRQLDRGRGALPGRPAAAAPGLRPRAGGGPPPARAPGRDRDPRGGGGCRLGTLSPHLALPPPVGEGRRSPHGAGRAHRARDDRRPHRRLGSRASALREPGVGACAGHPTVGQSPPFQSPSLNPSGKAGNMRPATNPRGRHPFALSALLLVTLAAGRPARADFPPPFHVDSTLDEHDAFPGDGQCVSTPSGLCTLRAAIEDVNAGSPRNVIIPAGAFTLTLGDINITQSQTITGEGAGQTAIDGNLAHRVFEIAHGALVDSAITGNIADTGGGLTNAGNGTALLYNVTVARNSAATNFIVGINNVGGGIENLGQLQLINVTLSENTAWSGGGLLNRPSATVTVTNTIVAGNTHFEDCSGTITSAGHNLAGGFSCLFSGPGDLNGAQALLDPRNDSGGFTYLYALLPGSEAIDAGDNTPVVCGTHDQRGALRPLDGDNNGSAVCDIGAFEYDPTAPHVSASLDPSANGNGWNSASVKVSWQVSDAESGVGSTSGCGTITLSAETAGTNVTCSATNTGGLTTTESVTVRIDKTAPTVGYSGNLGSYTVDQVISITCMATDALSGIDTTTCQDIAGPAFSFAAGDNTVSATATDRAGNTGTGSTTFTVVVSAPGLGTLTEQFVASAGVAHAMRAQLDAAEAAALRGNLRAKAGAVGAYQNHVSAQIGKTLTASQAAILIQLAGAL